MFSGISFSTIGFGDIVPGASLSAADEPAVASATADPSQSGAAAAATEGGGGLQSLANNTQFIFCFMYILFGMAVLAMCFNLMQEKVVQGVVSLGKKLGLVSDE